MIHSIGLFQAVRIAVAGWPDVAAFPSVAFGGSQPALQSAVFAWERVRYRRSGVALGASQGGKLQGVVSARRASGPTAWFVDHLVIRDDDAPVCELLESVAAFAGKRGVERLFLRVPDNGYLLKLVSQSGFSASSQVSLLTLPANSPLYKRDAQLGMRLRMRADDLGLFRLYNACTPAEVRFKTGMTLQRWQDGQEPRGKRTRDYVLEQNGEVVAWVRMDLRSGWVKVQSQTLSHDAVDPASLVAWAVHTGGRRTVWEVPEHQVDLQLLLQRMGFEVGGCYRLMVNSLAPMVRERAWAPAPTSV